MTSSRDVSEEKPIEPSSVKLSAAPRPAKSKSITQFFTVEELPRTTFHKVYRMIEKDNDEVKNYYFKKSITDNTPASELEAVLAAFYKLLAPAHVPSVYALYDEKNNYIGVLSEAIPGFHSIAEDPLKEEDIQVHFLQSANFSMDVFENLDAEIQALEKMEEDIKRRFRKSEESEVLLKNALENNFSDQLSKYFESNSHAKVTNYKSLCDIKKMMIDFYDRTLKEHSINKKMLENYRIVKGLAICLTASYLFMEDDLHQNNLSKFGKRIDFDMSWWPLLYLYKESQLIYLRKPNDDTFKITSQDILHFPDLKDAAPSYWPTKPPPGISEKMLSTIGSVLPMSQNAYPHQANCIYQQLAKNPVFIHYKYVTFAKYILMTPLVLNNIALLHIRSECSYGTTPLIDLIIQAHQKRLDDFKKVVMHIPEFVTFYKNNHQKITEELLTSLSKQELRSEQYKIVEMDVRKANSSFLEVLSSQVVHLAPPLVHQDTAHVLPLPNSAAAGALQELTIYQKIKNEVIFSMEQYKNPGISSGFGLFRNHSGKAEELVFFCKTLLVDSSDEVENIQSIQKLKNKIELILNVQSTVGDLYLRLTTLLRQINKVLDQSKQVAGLSLDR